MISDMEILTKGKYKFKFLKDVPIDYLIRIHKSGDKTNICWQYVNENMKLIYHGTRNKEPEAILISCSKRQYCDKKTANLELNRISGMIMHDKKPIRSYYCDECNSWHLTSVPINEFKNRT